MEIARHRRSYDRGQRIHHPARLQAVLASKQKALAATATARLAAAIPAAARFLDAAFQRGESAVTQTARLLRLVEDYGAAEVAAISPSPKTIPSPDLAVQLTRLGLKATAQDLDDFLARATVASCRRSFPS